MGNRPHVVIVGSGFGGLNAALSLAKAPVDVTIVDRDNYHGFWPLLYQVATAGLSPDDIARPTRSIYGRHPNIDSRLGTVTGVDLERRVVTVAGVASIPYDYLVLATGSVTNDYGVDGVTEHTFALKTLPEAVALRNHLLATLENADTAAAAGDEVDDSALTVVLAGGGPTGVEMAGALSELMSRELAGEFRHLDLARARVVLVEMSDHLLPGFARASQDAARRTLESRGVEVRVGTAIKAVGAGGVTFADGTSLRAATVVWSAGVQANPLAQAIDGQKGRGGTVAVSDDLSLADHPEVFVIGDLAASADGQGGQLPQLAPVAIQQGRHAALNIRRRVQGQPGQPFRYHDHGIMATIGRRSAVAEIPIPLIKLRLRLRGTPGWSAWLSVHLLFLIGFRNKAVVLVNWAWNYLTWERASRVVLSEPPQAQEQEIYRLAPNVHGQQTDPEKGAECE